MTSSNPATSARMQQRFSVVTLVNNDALYEVSKRSLAAQAPTQELEFLPIQADKRGWNAATGLNHGIDQADTDWVICVHQDVLFPLGWLARFRARLAELPSDTVVVGLVGRTHRGEFAGHIVDPLGHKNWTPSPRPVVSLDEHFIAVRRDSGVRFDPQNPGFHVYGADICHTAAANHFRAMTIDCPTIHVSAGSLDHSFSRAAEWLLDKWGKETGYVIPLTASMVHRRTIGNIWQRHVVGENLKRAIQPKWICHCKDVSLANDVLDTPIIKKYPFIQEHLARSA